jgi:TPR repeat protein
MRTFRAQVLIAVMAGLALSGATQPVFAQAKTAAEAALNMANTLDGAGGGISNTDLVAALEDAAAAGQPMALWQLGLMYESGEGVEKDPVKAFGYFSQIADEHADAAPKSVDAEIVAQSFVKVGEYYREGLPAAGVPKDIDYSNKLMMHAASYFGDADAQYRVGSLYQDDKELGDSPLQSARWLSLAARKGHAGAQAKLGNIMFNGDGIEPNPEEGLMWLTVAGRRAAGTPDEGWINQLLQNAMSVANPDQRKRGIELADTLSPKFGGLAAE